MKELNRRTAIAGISAVAAMAATASQASAAPGKAPKPGVPKEIRITWFGISNWRYQIGDLGIFLDGTVGFPASNPNPEVVAKVRQAIEVQGTIDYVLLGHLHGDHSVDTPDSGAGGAELTKEHIVPGRTEEHP